MKEIKTVVTEKHNLDNRDESIVLTTLKILDYQDFAARSEINNFQSNPPEQE